MKPHFHSVQFATLEQAEPILQRYLKFFITFLYGSAILYGAMYFLRSSLGVNSTPQIVSGSSKYCFRPNSNSSMAQMAGVFRSVPSVVPSRPIGSANTANIQKWSNPATWEGGVVPTSGQSVQIPANSAVLLDQNVDLKNIQVDGVLVVDYAKNINISTELLLVKGTTGYFELGTPSSPYLKNAIITLKGSDTSRMQNEDYKSILLSGGGEISIYGEVRSAWTMLNATANAGSSTLTLLSPMNWRVGDEIMVTTTGIETTGDGKDFNYTETEVKKIKAISGDKKAITLDSPLAYKHFGKLQTFSNGQRSWLLDERAEVGLLSRNIKIQGDASSLTSKQGGHIMVMKPSKANLAGVELSAMGQEGRLGRYPFHWHVAGDVKGQYFKNSVVKNCFNRAITVHATQNAAVDSNVVYNTLGHGIFLEDGNEQGNRVNYNLVSVVKQQAKGKNLLPSDVFFQGNRGQAPAGIWISNPSNIISNNAVSATGTGLWNAYAANPGGTAVNYKNKIIYLPITNMDNNRTHACYVGLMFDFVDNAARTDLKIFGYEAKNQVVRNFTGFKNYRSIWYRGKGNLEFSEFKTADDEGKGSFVPTNVAQFTNGLSVGRSENITGPENTNFATSMYDGASSYRNCHFVNYTGKQSVFLKFGGAIKNWPHYAENLTFDNCVIFDPEVDNHLSPQLSFMEDLDGSLTGNAGWWMTTPHPFIIDEVNFSPLQPGYSGMKTKFRFGRLRVIWDTDERKSTLYYEYADEHIAHTKPAGTNSDIPLMLDGGKRKYTIRFCDSIPSPLRIGWEENRLNDEAFFKLTGMPEELNVSSNITKVATLSALSASRASAYAYLNGEMHFHLINVSGEFQMTLTSKSGKGLTALESKSRPYKNTPRPTNSIIQAEHFDYGGLNAAYYEKGRDLILGNTGRDVFDVRPAEIIDFSRIDSTNFALVDFAKDEWVNYTVNIPKDGLYKLEANVSTQVPADQKLELFVDGVSKGQLTVPRSQSVYKVVNLGSYSFTKGARVVRFKAITGYARMDWFKLSSGAILPTVSITSPVNNATFNAPANVNIAATAADADGTIAKVEFFNGNTKLGEDLISPYTFSWTNVTAIGSYTITAQATDNTGNTSVSTAVIVKVVAPNVPPVVSIASPANNSTFNVPYNLSIKANASDQDGTITKVEFFNGTTKLGTDASAPYEYVYNAIPASIYNLTVKATDDEGAVTTSSVVVVTIKLVNDCANVPGGTAKLDTCGVCVGGNTGKTTLNTDGDKLPDCVDTDDDNDGLLDVNDCFPLDKTKGATTTWYQDADGDGKGNPNATKKACSQPAGYVDNNTDQCPTDPQKILPGNCGCGKTEASCVNKLPSVSFAKPLNLDIVEAGVTLAVNVTASDIDGTIASVSLYIDNTLVRTDIASPFTWGTGDAILQNLSLGNHILRAVVTDNSGGNTEASISIDAKAKDCANVLNGTAYLDVCNTCVGGTSGKVTLDFDDDQIPDCVDEDDDNDGVVDADDCKPLDPTVLGKTRWYADTDGDGYGDPTNSVLSCTQPTGYVEDDSDECPGQKNRNNAGDCGCDVPEGACFDCEGTPFGRSFLDSCLVCVKTTLEACTQDCAEVWGGTAFEDSCGICAGGTTNRIPVLDKSNCAVTGVLSEKSETGWTLSPNPSTGVFYFVTIEPVDVALFNVEGQMLYEAKVSGQATLGEQLPAGFYVLRIHKNGKQVGIERLIKH